MNAALEAHRRHLTALRDACAHRPEAHAHQLAALDRFLALAGDHDDLRGYRCSGGDLFELTRAPWLDRIANYARVAAMVGDRPAVTAAAVEYGEALEAHGHDDWPERVATASALTAPLRERGTHAVTQFTRLLLAVLALRAAASVDERAVWREHAAGAHRALLDADPGFDWARLEDEPRYALRTPWTGGGREVLGAWLAEVAPAAPPPEERAGDGDAPAGLDAAQDRWREGLAHLPAVDVTDDDVTIAAVAAPYRALAEAVTGDDRVAIATRRAALAVLDAVAGAPTGHDAAARLAAGGRLTDLAAAPLRERAEEVLERQAVWPDPLVAHHWRALLAGLDAARTPTEVELVSVHAEACFAVERDWNAIALEALLAPVRACFAGGLDRSAAATCRLTGLGGERLLELPRVRDFIDAILLPLAAHPPDALGAFDGEAGFDVVVAARSHLEEGGDRDLRAALRRLCDTARPARPQPFTLWGAEMDPEDLAEALARPPRPRL